MAVIAWVNIRSLPSSVKQLYFGTAIFALGILTIIFKLDIPADIMTEQRSYFSDYAAAMNIVLLISLCVAPILRICLLNIKKPDSGVARNYMFASLLVLTFAIAMPDMFFSKMNYGIAHCKAGYISSR